MPNEVAATVSPPAHLKELIKILACRMRTDTGEGNETIKNCPGPIGRATTHHPLIPSNERVKRNERNTD